MKKFGLFRGRPAKKHWITQEFDRSVVIDIYLCGIHKGASFAIRALDDRSPERASEIAHSMVESLTDDPLSMEALRRHVMEHMKRAVSHDIPGARR